KPGRWCGMHVKIAHDIAAYRQSQQQKDKQIGMAQAEQRVRAATAQPPMSVASTSQTSVMSTGVDTSSAAAQMQAMQHAALSAARAAAPQPPHCLPSTSSATAPAGYPTLAGLPPQALQSLALSGNPQMLSVLQEARRVAAATPKPPQAQMTPQRPPSAMPRPPQQPSGMTLPPGLATLGASGLSLAAPAPAAGSITNGT
ncbi:hypothetical protein TELCIR_20319, partial [Teladorsagia circumcincta]